MFIAGFLVGLIAGVLLIWWAAHRWTEPQPLFQRLLQGAKYAVRTDMKLLLHELNQKTEESLELARRVEKRLQRLEEHLHQEMLTAEKDHRKAVYHLQREGLTPPEIASVLGLGRGEVELILSLAQK